jgi:hypothetical protein
MTLNCRKLKVFCTSFVNLCNIFLRQVENKCLFIGAQVIYYRELY